MKDTQDISRQAKKQRENKANGLCTQCPKPSNGKQLCDDCASKRGVKRRHDYDAWKSVDWTLSDNQIGTQLSRSKVAVMLNRKIHSSITNKQAILRSKCEHTWNTCYPDRRPWSEIGLAAQTEWLRVFEVFRRTFR